MWSGLVGSMSCSCAITSDAMRSPLRVSMGVWASRSAQCRALARSSLACWRSLGGLGLMGGSLRWVGFTILQGSDG